MKCEGHVSAQCLLVEPALNDQTVGGKIPSTPAIASPCHQGTRDGAWQVFPAATVTPFSLQTRVPAHDHAAA